MRAFGALAGVGFAFVLSIAIGFAGGYLLDRWLHTEPYAVTLCTLLAVAGGFVRLIQVLRRFERLDREPQP